MGDTDVMQGYKSAGFCCGDVYELWVGVVLLETGS
jgi:hypothetical protein